MSTVEKNSQHIYRAMFTLTLEGPSFNSAFNIGSFFPLINEVNKAIERLPSVP
jgi:hypothetical protein